MDRPRYLAYKTVQHALDGADAWLLDVHERERLRDIAEALLLTPATDEEDAERLRRDAALALSLLVGQKRITDVEADTLWHAIADSGPRALTPAG